MSSCSGRLNHGRPGWGPQEGRASPYARSTARRSTPRQLGVSDRLAVLGNYTSGPGGTLAALPHRAQSSVRVNANRESFLTRKRGFPPFRSPPLGHLETMAAVALPPVVVDSPAGAPTSGCPIFLSANSGVVSSTPGLDWQPAPAGPGGAARVQLMTFQAIKAFLPRCRISRIPADLAAASSINALTVRLTDVCWSRILTELNSAQVFARAAR